MMTNNMIICKNCGHEWKESEGGDDKYICHLCGVDNTPKNVSEIKRLQKLSGISEGGWSSTLTQNTKLTPKIVDECISLYSKFVKEFNSFLEGKGIAPVKAGNPVGSSAYYKKDMLSDPNKEYGDVDMMFYVPKTEGVSDNKINSVYSKEIMEFINDKEDVSSQNGKNLIFKLRNGGWAQIDLVNAYIENEEWAQARMTPERGIKGAIGGYLYSALGEVLNLSISAHGVQIKIKDKTPVKFKSTKVDKLDTVSNNAKIFGLDIVKYFYEIIKNVPAGQMKISKSLRDTPGINPEDMKNSDVVKVIKGIGDTLQINGLFGKSSLSDIASVEEYLSQIRDVYSKKLDDAINASKFDKAEGEEGQRKAKETKEKFLKGKELVLQYLS